MVRPVNRAVGGPASGSRLEERNEGEVLAVRTLEVVKRGGRAVHARRAPVRSDVFAEHSVARAGCKQRHFLLLQLFAFLDLIVHHHEACEGHHNHQSCQSHRLND